MVINVRARTTKRSDISDLFDTPFWDRIPDKPSKYSPSSHASTHLSTGNDEIGRAAKLIVSTDGKGDYSSIQSAIEMV